MPDVAVSRRGVLIRIGIYAFLTYMALLLIAFLLHTLNAGLLLTAVLSTFCAAALGNSLALRIYERLHLADAGLHWSAASGRHILLGLAGGSGAALVVLGLPLLAGAAVLKADPLTSPSAASFLFTAVVLLFGAVGEEMLFRGYGFQAMIPAFGTWGTVLPMGVLFGAAHSTNANVTYFGLLNTVAWGVLLGFAVLKSGDLWLAIGIHFGWNFTLPLFGVNVSGFTMRLTGYSYEWLIDGLWSGGAYGPEGGVLCSLVLLLLIGFFARAPIQKQRLPLIEAR